MATIVALLGAAGSIGLGAYSASQAPSGGVGTKQIPAAGSQRALRDVSIRTMAQNLGATPPSFLDYIHSGGKARLPVKPAVIKPQEAVNLGFVDIYGREIPGYDPATQTKLNPQQALFLGRVHARAGKDTPLARYARLENKVTRLQTNAEDASLDPKIRAKSERQLPKAKARFLKMLADVSTAGIPDQYGPTETEQALAKALADSKDKSKILGYLSGGGASKLLGF